MLIAHVHYRWVVKERNFRIYPILTVFSKFTRCESSYNNNNNNNPICKAPECQKTSVALITACGNYCKRRSQNTHHWSGRTEPATENGVGQADGSRRHCGSHSSVASLIAPDQWCVFCTPSLAVFPTRYNQLDSNRANLEATVEMG